MKESLQYKRTDKAIVNAFIALCKKQSFDQITVKDILDEALVSRNTFYAHYKDKYEIVEMLFSNYIESFQDSLDAIYKTDKISIYSLQDEKRVQALKQRHGKFSDETRDIFDVLLKIHTDQVDLLGAMEHYFFEKYLGHVQARQKDLAPSDPDTAIEAKIYAAIECAMIRAGFSDIGASLSQDPDHLSQNMINATLFAVGVRDSDVQKQLSDLIMERRKDAMMANDKLSGS